jgi:O-antigen/teichoic acid export membrane protein
MVGWVKTLFKDSIIYGIGFGVSRFLQVLILPIIAKSLSVSEYGYYSNYVIFYTIAGAIFLLGMDNSVARFLFDSEKKEYHRKVFSIAFFCVLLLSAMASLLLSFFPDPLLQVINVPPGYFSALPYVILTIPVLVLNNFFLSWFKWKRQKSFFLINSIGVVILLLAPLLIAQQSNIIDFLLVFKIIFFSQLLIAAVSTALCLQYIRFVFDSTLFLAMLKYGFPWMLVFLLGLSRSYLDRLFLTRYLDNNTYGVYNFSVRLATLLSLIIAAFEMSFGPLAYSIWNKEGASAFFARLQSAYTLLLSSAACVITIVSPLLVLLLGGAKYSGAEMVLPFILFSAIPLTLINFSSIGTAYAKKSFLSTITLFIGFAAVLLLNIMLTPRYLQYGAVNASLIGHILITASGYYFSRKYYKIAFNFTKDAAVFVLFLIFSIAAVQFHISTNVYQDMGIKLFILFIAGFFILFFFFKNEVRKVLSLARNLRYAFASGNAGI